MQQSFNALDFAHFLESYFTSQAGQKKPIILFLQYTATKHSVHAQTKMHKKKVIQPYFPSSDTEFSSK